MNGRTASRAIQSRIPTTTAAAMRTATLGDSGAKRGLVETLAGSTKGGGGREATHSVDVVAAGVAAPGAGSRSAADRPGSSIVGQTTRRVRALHARRGASPAMALRGRARCGGARAG